MAHVRKHCQMDDGECAYLIGTKCKADPKNPFWVTSDFHSKLKVVGCASWSKYMEYDNGECNPVQELQVPEMGVGGDSEQQVRPEAVPVHILQEDSATQGRTPYNEQPVGHDMTEEHKCDVCGERAVIRDVFKEGAKYLCFKHHEEGWCCCLTFDKIVAKYKEEQNGKRL